MKESTHKCRGILFDKKRWLFNLYGTTHLSCSLLSVLDSCNNQRKESSLGGISRHKEDYQADRIPSPEPPPGTDHCIQLLPQLYPACTFHLERPWWLVHSFRSTLKKCKWMRIRLPNLSSHAGWIRMDYHLSSYLQEKAISEDYTQNAQTRSFLH